MWLRLRQRLTLLSLVRFGLHLFVILVSNGLPHLHRNIRAPLRTIHRKKLFHGNLHSNEGDGTVALLFCLALLPSLLLSSLTRLLLIGTLLLVLPRFLLALTGLLLVRILLLLLLVLLLVVLLRHVLLLRSMIKLMRFKSKLFQSGRNHFR